jgi:hypothetical protein
MNEKSKDVPASTDRAAESAVAYTAQPGTVSAEAARRVSDLTVAELRGIIRDIVREEQRPLVDVDDEGYLVFRDEASYVAYLDSHPDKYPSELHAYFIDPHGFKVHYSDYEPTPEKAKELEEIEQEPTVPGDEVFAKLRKAGIDV